MNQPTLATPQRPDHLANFLAEQTPVNAVRLAVSDHKAHAGNLIHWDFVTNLRKAEAMAEQFPALMKILETSRGNVSSLCASNPAAFTAWLDAIDEVLNEARKI